MKIFVVAPTGMCGGVERAIVMAEEVAREQGFSLGPVVHNPAVVQRLSEKGLRQIDLDEVQSGSTLLIRSHGASPLVYKTARERGVKIVDATCPHVLRLQKEAAKAVTAGMDVVIVGDSTHPEIEAVLAHAAGRPFVVRGTDDLRGLPLKEQIAVMAQTTASPVLWQTVVEWLDRKSVV